MPELSDILAAHRTKGYVIAPAGFGKTYLIAESVKHSDNRQLVLTHTYAGVNALSKKMYEKNVAASKYKLDTVASWTLRLCLSYPKSSNWDIPYPEGKEWRDLYQQCVTLLDKGFIKRIIRASYDGIYVDEYQDCSVGQHALVLKLATILPVRILGDYLQSIFEFSDEASVDWNAQVIPDFELLGGLSTPWRWKNAKRDKKGEWLAEIRKKIEASESIDLSDHVPAGVKVYITSSDDELRNKQITVCKYFSIQDGENVVAIHKGDGQYKAKCHALAKQTSGRFSTIEEVEGKRLFLFLKKYDRVNSSKDKLLLAITFAREKCMSSVGNALSAGTKRGEAVQVRQSTRNIDLALSANNFLDNDTPENLKLFFLELKKSNGTVLYARDLFNRLMNALSDFDPASDAGLTDAANKFQKRFRHAGRPIRFSKIVSTTLLVKGLEFDHAIVLNAASLSKKDLYVALTRGSKSLTIISSQSILNPHD